MHNADGRLWTVSDREARFSVAAVSGVPGTVIPLKIRLPNEFATDPASKAAYTFVMFKGLPEAFKFSSGFRTRNSWMVAINEVNALKLEVPPDFQGGFTMEALLYRGENSQPEKDVVYVTISASGGTARVPTSTEYTAASAAALEKPAKPAGRREMSITKEEETALLGQGAEQIQSGNIVFARLLFEQLAANGSARGTFELARTYDPAVLQQLGAVGIQGDKAKARSYYEKAAELGSAQGAEMIGALGK